MKAKSLIMCFLIGIVMLTTVSTSEALVFPGESSSCLFGIDKELEIEKDGEMVVAYECKTREQHPQVINIWDLIIGVGEDGKVTSKNIIKGPVWDELPSGMLHNHVGYDKNGFLVIYAKLGDWLYSLRPAEAYLEVEEEEVTIGTEEPEETQETEELEE